MGFRATGVHQLRTHRYRERQIGKAASVQVSQLPAADAELDAAEAMR
jgi:hypothetical protein